MKQTNHFMSLKFSYRRFLFYYLPIIVVWASFCFLFYNRFKADEPALSDGIQFTEVVWDGGGTDESCSQQLALPSTTPGSGGWWSCGLNWSGDIAPGPLNDVLFTGATVENPTGNKDSFIDTLAGNSVHDLIIEYGYSGTVTQVKDFSISGSFEQNNGTFDSNPQYSFNVGSSFLVANNNIGNGEVLAIKKDSKGALYAGGSFTSVNNAPIKYLAVHDGKRWRSLGNFDGQVRTIAIDSDDNVYVGGSFTKIGNLAVNGIARWNSTSWSALDDGVYEGYGTYKTGSEVFTLAIDSQNHVYAGGAFDHAGTTNYVNHVAKWNGEAWEKLGYGVGTTTRTYQNDWNSTTTYNNSTAGKTIVVKYNNNYYANISSSNNVNHLPTDMLYWHPYPNLVGQVNTLYLKKNANNIDDDLYVGGDFWHVCLNETCTDSTVTSNIARWDGANLSYSDIGGSLPNAGSTGYTVNSITFDDSNNLIISGNDTESSPITKIWNGTSWSNMAGSSPQTNISDSQRTLYSRPAYSLANVAGAVFVGGGFQWYGPNKIAKWVTTNADLNNGWMGRSWGNGLDESVRVLENIGGELYAGGDFSLYCDSAHACTHSSTAYSVLENGLKLGTNLVKINTTTLAPTPIFSSARFSRFTGNGTAQTPYLVTDKYSLQASLLNTDANYKLLNDINLAGVGSWNNNQGFLPIATEKNVFNGVFDGDNHAITNIVQNNFSQDSGLFGCIGFKGTVKNLNVSDFTFQSDNITKNVGLLAGSNQGQISDIGLTGSLIASSTSRVSGFGVGGAIGANSGNITNMNVATDISGNFISKVGGAIGIGDQIVAGQMLFDRNVKTSSTLSGIESHGSITLTNSLGKVGGVIGAEQWDKSTIKNSASTVNITITDSDADLMSGYSTESVGGLAGYNYATLANNQASGNITITSTLVDSQAGQADSNPTFVNYEPGGTKIMNVGGMTGESMAPISASSHSGNITINNKNAAIHGVGGLSGIHMNGAVTGSSSAGAIDLVSDGQIKYVGGLIGSVENTSIDNSSSSGELQIANPGNNINRWGSSSFGGFVGSSNLTAILNSNSSVNLNINSDLSCGGNEPDDYASGKVGGFVGSFDGAFMKKVISKSFSTGSIASNCNHTGGFAGQASGHISESFSTGNVSGEKWVGGFVGTVRGQKSQISNSFSAGDVNLSGHTAGAFAGYTSDAILSNNYALGRVTGPSKLGGFIGAFNLRDASFSSNYWLSIEDSYNSSLADTAEERADGMLETNIATNKDIENISSGNKDYLKIKDTFSGWDFDNIWDIKDDASYPTLKTFSNLAPVVTSTNSTAITGNSASLAGEITGTNGFAVNTRGFEYGINQQSGLIVGDEGENTTLGGNYLTGPFTKDLTSLSSGTKYYYRAFAVNIAGIAYGDWQELTTTGQQQKIGDINQDTKVDELDFTLLLFNWGNNPANLRADINSDTFVDELDFTLLLFWWGDK